MAIKKLLIKTAIGRIANHKKYKTIKSKRRAKRKAHKKRMIEMFGGVRYYLSLWFGPWVLYTANKSFYVSQLQPVETEEKPQPKVQRKKQPKVVALPSKAKPVCDFCGGEDIYLQGTKAIMPCPKCKRNTDKVRVAK